MGALCVALIFSNSVSARKNDVYFNTELSYMDISSEGDSASPLALFFRLGKELSDGFIIEAFVGTGLTDDVLYSEDVGFDTFRTYAELSRMYGVNAKFQSKLSHNSNVFLTAGYAKTEIDLVFEDCFGGAIVNCSDDTLSASDDGVTYGAGFNYGGFILSYNVFFDDFSKDIDADAKVTGINIGYIAKF